MSDEDRLRDRLHAQTGEVPIVPDLDDVAVRIGRRGRNRTRPLVAAAVAAVVVGAVIVAVADRADTPGAVSVSAPIDSSAAEAGSTTTGHSIKFTECTDVSTTVPPPATPAGPSGPICEGFSPGAPTGPTGLPSGLASGAPSGGTDEPFVEGTVTATTLPPKGQFEGVPTQVLPAPGAEQPADPESARQGVTQAVIDATDGAAANETRAAAIEGGSQLLTVIEQLRAGQFGSQVNTAKTVVMGVVFATPTRAVVQFRADLASGGISGPYVIDVNANEHGWQVARESYCRLIGPAGVTCP